MTSSRGKMRGKGTVTLPEQYGVAVGSAWVAIDFVAQALYVEIQAAKVAKTVSLSPGVLVDYDKDENIIGVEVIG